MDVSVNGRVGKGCYLVITGDDDKQVYDVDLVHTTSTYAELELAVLVLQLVGTMDMILYTDCANLVTLPTRHYSRRHKSTAMYDRLKTLLLFYRVKIVKVRGHRKREAREHPYEDYFSYVDKRARAALRK